MNVFFKVLNVIQVYIHYFREVHFYLSVQIILLKRTAVSTCIYMLLAHTSILVSLYFSNLHRIVNAKCTKI